MSVPSTDDLRSFLLGTLPPAEAERVSTWVHDTPPAADALRQVLAADAVTEVLSDTARRTPLPADRVEQVVRSVMQSLRPAPGTSKPVAVIPEEVGDFRVRRELGRGGMGVVLEAEDGLLHRLVAIKLIAAESAGEPGSRERFLREARSAAAIQHENVVPVHQVGDASGLLFIVMPLLQGETLDARLRREGRLPPAEAARVAREVAAGLAAAHERGLIHRDIKPSNIWLEEKTGRVKILDFGLARLAAEDGPEPLTQRGALVGTPAYMSPEQARGESLDARTDLFSLGVVLYQMLTGRLPFTAGNTTGLLLAVTTATPPRPCDLNPEAPADLDQLVMHLLMKDRAARPASAAAVGDALVRIETSLNQTMRMSERPETLPKPSPAPLRSRGRRVAPWAVAATTFLAFVATLGVIIIKIKHKDGTETTITVPDGIGLVVEQEGKTLARIEPKAAGPRVDPAAFAAGHSPLDKLDPNQIPKEERFPWQPKELVAVIGSHCQRSWGLESGTALFHGAQALALRSDGELIAYADNGLSLWNPKTNKRLEFRDIRNPFAMIFHPDGTRLLGIDRRDGWCVWDVTGESLRKVSGQMTIPEKEGYEREWSVSRDGKVLVGWGLIYDWSDKDKPVLRAEIGLKALPDDTFTTRISPDGQSLAVGTRNGGLVTIFDLSEKQPKARVMLPDTPEGKAAPCQRGAAFDFHPDGRLAVMHADGVLRLWDVSGEKPTVVAATKKLPDVALARPYCSPDGRHVILSQESGLRLFRLPENGDEIPAPLARVEQSRFLGNIGQGQFSADGKVFVTTHLDRWFTIWDIADGTLKARPQPEGYHDFAISADGERIVALRTDKRVARFRLEKSEPTLETDSLYVHGYEGIGRRGLVLRCNTYGWCRPLEAVNDTGWKKSPVEGSFIPIVSDGKLVCYVVRQQAGWEFSIWDLENDPPKRLTASALTSADDYPQYITTDGKHLITSQGYWEGAARLWRIADGALTKIDELKEMTSGVAGSPDGKMLAFRNGQLFDISEGKFKPVTSFSVRTDRSSRPPFSPDGRYVAFCGPSLDVFDWKTKERVYSWDAPGMGVLKVDFAPDGRHLVTGNANGTIYILRLPELSK